MTPGHRSGFFDGGGPESAHHRHTGQIHAATEERTERLEQIDFHLFVGQDSTRIVGSVVALEVSRKAILHQLVVVIDPAVVWEVKTGLRDVAKLFEDLKLLRCQADL
ncbi:hypothetical protein [Synechococcus sp. LA31]|uniref:hypothetical protein n=1 Tax=Synechococcus sp. LA31 TaxID=2741953 RepID=UPI001BDD7A64|nr:hypothetical protein [Synechococcus sp. LA31]QVV67921.1 hypothetical protein KJJ24_01605 [Synechococcus sp. LA31]